VLAEDNMIFPAVIPLPDADNEVAVASSPGLVIAEEG